MGIWHNIIIDHQKNVRLFENIFVPYDSLNHIRLDDKNGKLGLVSSLNTKNFLTPQLSFKQVSIAIDGRIYNAKSLCNTLDINVDIDVGSLVLSLYERNGHDGIYQLNGAFSLILYDRQKEITLLYRSFLTGFPLYYVTKNNLLSVSTNPVDLLHRSDISNRFDIEQMSGFFALDPTGWNDTIFLELNEVEHGEMVLISSDGVVSTKRALNDVLIPPNYISESETIETYRHLVDSAVEKNIFPNKKYGIMLSSGMDSSTLAVFASKHLKEQGSELKAYSWSLPSYQKADETKKIKELCSELDIELTLFDAEKFMPFSNLDDLTLQPEMPFTNLFSPMISELYRIASEDGVNILLNGHYGDNLFPSTRDLFIDILKDKRYELFISTLRSVISQVGYANTIRHSPSIRRLIKYFLPFYKSKKPVFYAPEWLSTQAKESRRSVWEHQKKEIEEGYEAFTYALSKRSTSSGMGRYTTEKFGIERLEPYTDVELLNYTLRLPSYMSYRNGQMKYVAREAMRGLLPESIRTQGRVGLLNRFAYDGFMKHKDEVRERLFDEREAWKVYVDEKWMEDRFKNGVEVKDKELLVIWMSLHMVPWQKAIKPGGSLYEGTFMETGSNGVKR